MLKHTDNHPKETIIVKADEPPVTIDKRRRISEIIIIFNIAIWSFAFGMYFAK